MTRDPKLFVLGRKFSRDEVENEEPKVIGDEPVVGTRNDRSQHRDRNSQSDEDPEPIGRDDHLPWIMDG